MFPNQPSSAIQQGFFEKIRNFPPSDILQMCCLSRRSGEMRFQSGEQNGLIFLEKGEVIHAQLENKMGTLAAAEILSWPPGEFTFRDGVDPPHRTLKTTWDQLLEASHTHQKTALADEAPPPPPGFEAVDATSTSALTSGAVIDPATQTGRLLIYGENVEGRTIDINLPSMSLGRAPTNNIILQDAAISSRHCMFLLSNGRVTVRDLNSSNGTFVNGQAVTEAQLEMNDVIRVGTALIKFEIAMRRPKLRSESTLLTPRPALHAPRQFAGVEVTRILPEAEPEEEEAPAKERSPASMSGPISYARITRSEKRSRPGTGQPLWLIVLLAVTVLIVIYLIVASQTWAPAGIRLW